MKDNLKKLENIDNSVTIQSYQMIFYLRSMELVGLQIPDKYKDIVNIGQESFYTEIREILYYHGIRDTILKNNMDIITFYNFIIKEIFYKIRDILKTIEPMDVYYSLYSIAAYQAEFHTRLMNVINESYTILECKNISDFEKEILTFLFNNKDHVTEFDSLIAMDKNVIQYLFKNYSCFESIESNYYKLDKMRFSKVFLLTLIIMQLISERELATSKFSKYNEIQIKDYMILNVNYDLDLITKIKKTYINDFSVNLFYNPEKIMSKLDDNLYKSVGFKLDTIMRFIFSNNKTIPDIAITMITDKETIIRSLKTDGKCSYEEANRILDYLTIENSVESQRIFDSLESYSNRIFEKSFFRIGMENNDSDLYLFSYPLLLHSYEMLRRKLIYNIIPECKKLNSRIIQKYCKNELVITSKEKLAKYTDDIQINVHKFTIEDGEKKKKVVLSNEVDVLALIDKKLFLIECKDIYYSFTPFGFRQDIKKTINYIETMKTKEKNVSENIMHIESLFKKKIDAIIPLIIFRNYNISIDSSLEKEGVYITNFLGLEDWIKDFL